MGASILWPDMFVKKRTAAAAASPGCHTPGSVIFIALLILSLSSSMVLSCRGKQNEAAAQPAQNSQSQNNGQLESSVPVTVDSPEATQAAADAPTTETLAEAGTGAAQAVQDNSAAPARTSNDTASAAVSMQPRPRPQAAATAGSGTITVASSLSGTDRHLIHRPLDRILPEDFIIGGLQDPAAASQPVSGLLQAAIQSLKQGELPASLLSPDIRLLTGIIYAADLKAAAAVKEIRLGSIQNGRGGILELPFRLIGESYRSKGLLVLDPASDPPMIIHFSLNSSGLGENYTAPDSFDPHGVLY